MGCSERIWTLQVAKKSYFCLLFNHLKSVRSVVRLVPGQSRVSDGFVPKHYFLLPKDNITCVNNGLYRRFLLENGQ